MVRKAYNPSASAHQHHFGHGMSRFRGSRMQYGSGLGSLFKRVVLPMVSKGVKAAAPHLLKAAKGIGKDVLGKAMNGSIMAPMPQTPSHRRRRQKKGIKRKNGNRKGISRKKFEANTSGNNNIF